MGTAQERSFSLLLGPAEAGAAKQAAAAGAARIHTWLQTPGTSVELRRAGSREGQELMKFQAAAELERALGDSAAVSAEGGLSGFLNALDLAAYALGRRPGTRILVAILQAPAAGDETTHRLLQTTETCKAAQIRVLVMDLAAGSAKDGAARWRALADATGGAFVRDFEELESKLPAAAAAAAKPAQLAAKSERLPDGPVVFTKLFPTSPASAGADGKTLSAMRGLFIVECPMSTLQFNTEGGNAVARARVTQIVKNKDGQIGWEAKKDITVKGPASKLSARQAGSLFYMREVKLPGGQYTVEAAVEDLNASKTGAATEPVRAVDSIPGLAASGAMFVRKPEKSADVTEGDSILQYAGEALVPRLNPVFPAGQPFDLPVYFVFYPTLEGKRPHMRLDVLQNGQAVGGMDLAFSDSLKDDSREGRGATMSGEQKHEFPYLAKLANAFFSPGKYEVRVTIRQESTKIERIAAFRVE